MPALMMILAALAADPAAAAAPADGLGCVYAQLGEAGRGVVARAFDEGGDAAGDPDALTRANTRLAGATTACSERLHWDSRPVRGEMASDYAMERALADFYEKLMRDGGVDRALVESVYQSLPADQRLSIYRHDAPDYAGSDDKLAAQLAKIGEYAEDATWDTRMPMEVFPTLAEDGGLHTKYPGLTYLYIWRWYEARFEAENIARLWAIVDSTQ